MGLVVRSSSTPTWVRPDTPDRDAAEAGCFHNRHRRGPNRKRAQAGLGPNGTTMADWFSGAHAAIALAKHLGNTGGETVPGQGARARGVIGPYTTGGWSVPYPAPTLAKRGREPRACWAFKAPTGAKWRAEQMQTTGPEDRFRLQAQMLRAGCLKTWLGGT